MFTRIPNLPDYTVGIIATGKITKKDYKEVLWPALHKVTDGDWKGINMLLVMKTELEKFSIGAWLEDIKLNAAYFLKWNKLAIVTNTETMEKITSFFDLIVPGEAKTFPMDKVEEAKAWVSEP